MRTEPVPKTLGDKQRRLTKMLISLLQKAHELGYEVTLGDAFRDPRVFGLIGETKGYGFSRSAHKSRLAIDLNLFKDGKYLSTTEDHEPLGVYWESLGGTWGGRFKDGNHYSIENEGIM